MTKVLQTGAAQPGPKLTTVIPVRIKRSGGRRWMIPAAGGADGGVEAPKHEMPVLTALSRAFHWQRLLDEGRVASGSEIARREGLHPTTVNELLRLSLLSPAVVRASLAGKQPRTLSLIWLKNNELPYGPGTIRSGCSVAWPGSTLRRSPALTANHRAQVVDLSTCRALASHRSHGEKRGWAGRKGGKWHPSASGKAPHQPAKPRQCWRSGQEKSQAVMGMRAWLPKRWWRRGGSNS